MPPLAYPNGPNAAPNIGSAATPYNPVAPDAVAATASTGGKPNDILRRILIANGYKPDEADYYIASLEQQQQAYTASSGFANKQLQSQIDDAKKNREQAWRLAQFQASTSSDLQNRQLQQQAYQFQQNHGLEVARAVASYESSPDMMFAEKDFKNALGRVSQGYSPAPMAEQGTPHAKTYEDFAALSNYQPAGATASAGMAGAGGGADKRLKAMKAVSDAMPPSDGVGHDDQDWAAIDAIKNLYFSGRPGDVERLGAPRRKIAQAGLARAGYDPAAVENERMRGLPGQGATRAA